MVNNAHTKAKLVKEISTKNPIFIAEAFRATDFTQFPNTLPKDILNCFAVKVSNYTKEKSEYTFAERRIFGTYSMNNV